MHQDRKTNQNSSGGTRENGRSRGRTMRENKETAAGKAAVPNVAGGVHSPDSEHITSAENAFQAPAQLRGISGDSNLHGVRTNPGFCHEQLALTPPTMGCGYE
jgi:hypothetical protein